MKVSTLLEGLKYICCQGSTEQEVSTVVYASRVLRSGTKTFGKAGTYHGRCKGIPEKGGAEYFR